MSFLPTGGLFVTGGLTANHIHRMANNEDEESSSSSLFMKAYIAKGRASFLLDDIPLYAVTANNTGLRGAAVRANMVIVTTLRRTCHVYTRDNIIYLLLFDISHLTFSKSMCIEYHPMFETITYKRNTKIDIEKAVTILDEF